MPDSSLATAELISPSNSGRGYNKTFGVIHDIESPPGPEWAESLGGPNYMQNPANKVSVQYVTDSDTVVQTGWEDAWCWGAGPYANKRAIQIEQAGYASFTEAQWLGDASAVGSTYVRPDGTTRTYTAQDAADMAAQLELLAHLVADISKRHGWRTVVLTADELRAASNNTDVGGGWVEHRDVSNILGGTGHHDAGEGYPIQRLMDRATQINQGISPTPLPEDPVNQQDIDNIADAVVDKLTKKKMFPTNIYNPTTKKETFSVLSWPDTNRAKATMLARVYRKLVG